MIVIEYFMEIKKKSISFYDLKPKFLLAIYFQLIKNRCCIFLKALSNDTPLAFTFEILKSCPIEHTSG